MTFDHHNSPGFLFDLDGVLIDSESEYTKIWETVNNEYPTGISSLASCIKGCTLDKILDDHYPDPSIRKKVVERLYELEKKMKYNYLPGAYELLCNLKERKIPIALVTSSNDVKMAHLVEELPEITSFFTHIVTADQISNSKPDPEGYLLGAKKIGRNILNCVVFEDSLQGVKAGRNSGAFVIGVAGTLSRETISPFADYVVNSLDEINLEQLILTLSNRHE